MRPSYCLSPSPAAGIAGGGGNSIAVTVSVIGTESDVGENRISKLSW